MIIDKYIILINIFIFVLLFLFIKTIDDRKWLTILVTLVITPLFYFYVFYPVINIFSSYHHQKYFTAEKWIKNKNLRYELSDDLLKTHIQTNNTKEQIKTILGEPEWLGWNYNTKGFDENVWFYNLGILPNAFNPNQKELTIYFTDNKVIKVETSIKKTEIDEK